MKPRPFLAAGYLLAGTGWLLLGLLGTKPNEDWWHFLVPLIQAGGALVAAIAAFVVPRVAGLFLHWTSLGVLAMASAALTVHAFDEPNGYVYAHAAQSLGLLIAMWYAIQWWLASGGLRYARPFAAGHLLAALAAFTLLGLNFIGQGHPLQTAQRPYAATYDAFVGVGLVLAAWMGGISALTLKTPEPIIKP